MKKNLSFALKGKLYAKVIGYLLYFIVLFTMLSCNGKENTQSDAAEDSLRAQQRLAELQSEVSAILDSFPQFNSDAVFVDTSNSPEFMRTISKIDSSEFQTISVIEPLVIDFYSEPDFKGKKLSLNPGQYTPNQFSELAGGQVRSINVPFGLCADVLFNTAIQPRISPALASKGIFRNLFPLKINRKYDPGAHGSIEPLLQNVALITIYPWTDFYLSTDDPTVPGFLDEVMITFTNNGNSYKGGVSGKMNDTDRQHHKIFTYQMPKGKKPNLWVSTGNGKHGWSHKIDPATNTLTVDLWVSVRPPAGPRNWIGVRASL